MQIRLLTENYKSDYTFYDIFCRGALWQSSFVSDDYVTIPSEIPDFKIYFAIKDKERRNSEYCGMITVVADSVICLDRDIYMDERFWHSLLCLYKRDFLVDTYPQILQSYELFQNIVLRDFNWENYIYKAILIAQYVGDIVPESLHQHYYRLILNNMDMFNYIIKYEIFRNGSFLINIMDIIEETGLSSVLKARIKDRPDLAKDERYGRRVIFELNKAYPVVMSPMLGKEALKQYFLKYLSYYVHGNVDISPDDEGEF